VATIIDTDEPPGFSVGDVSVVEGNGTKTVLAVVTLSAKLKASASVRLATTATGTATVGVDYVAKAPTTVTFPAGTVRKTVAITIRGDMVIEPNETFGLVLSSPIGAPIIDGTGVVTIVDDDRAPVLSVQPVSTVEGNSGTRLATFSLRLDRPFGKTVSVKYRTANGTATAGTDYTAKALTTVSFTPGQTTKTVTVTIRGDLVKEPNETYTLQLSAPVNVTLTATQVTGTITNDD
jgi:septal ring-binding cell division protein DamX